MHHRTLFLLLLRAVRGAVVHGDARRPFLQKLWRFHCPDHCVFLLWSSNSCHSTHYGRLVSLLTRTAFTLVSVKLFFYLLCFAYTPSSYFIQGGNPVYPADTKQELSDCYYLKKPKKIPSITSPDWGMGGICDFSVKRSLRCYISIDLLKIEPGHFPEGELRFRPQDWASCEQVQVDSGMATMGHEPHCLCAAVLILLSSFLKLILTIFFLSFLVHRVEFQNKFYSGQGFKFLPFTFESILDGRFDEWRHSALESRCDVFNSDSCMWRQ